MLCLKAKANGNTQLLDSIFDFQSRAIAMLDDSVKVSTDISYEFYVQKRNFTLMFVPSMFEISRGKRRYEGTAQYASTIYRDGTIRSTRLNYNANTYHGRRVMKVTDNLLFPNIYNRTFFDDLLLSPFHRSNKRFYKYRVTRMANGMSEVLFIPKTRNTQLLSGRAFVETGTGRIFKVDVQGEYDMTKFVSHIYMNMERPLCLIPKSISTDISFSFVGNKIYSSIKSLPTDSLQGAMGTLPVATDTLSAVTDTGPKGNSIEEAARDSVGKGKDVRPLYKRMDFLVTSINTQFGKENSMRFRMSPIINPMYVSYNHRRGITYRMKMNLDWAMTDSIRLKLSPNIGYSFKQHKAYYTIPLKLDFGGRHNTYIAAETGRTQAYYDDIAYNDTYLDTKLNYNPTQSLGIQVGVITHKRLEHTFAPYTQIIYRPQSLRNTVLTFDYERSFPNVFGANAKYEKYESSATVKCPLDHVSSLTAKMSGGLYSLRSDGTYTLDYKNFRYNYLPDGWEDWGGEFQLLSKRIYNQSEWYVANNICYETPMLAFSYLPIIGKYTEEERLYCNILFAEQLHPYIEYGYAFANRLFSLGFFLSTTNFKVEGFGINFSFEMFNKW